MCVCVWGGGGGGGGGGPKRECVIISQLEGGGGGPEACYPEKIWVLVTLRYRKVDLKLTNSVTIQTFSA